jgi:hypothetical protein
MNDSLFICCRETIGCRAKGGVEAVVGNEVKKKTCKSLKKCDDRLLIQEKKKLLN